jgi:DNA polymerase-3 subunit alpha
MGRACGAGEVRLPRPEDADGAGKAVNSQTPPRHRHRSAATLPLDDKKTYEMLARARRSACSSWKVRACARALRHEARPLRGHHRAGGALSPGPDGQHPDLHARASTARRVGLHASDAGADPEGDLRRHHLSGTGDADRAGDGGLQLGEADLLRRAMGKKIKREMDKQRARFVEGAIEERRARRKRPKRSSSCSRKFADYGFNKSHAAPMRWSPIRPPT